MDKKIISLIEQQQQCNSNMKVYSSSSLHENHQSYTYHYITGSKVDKISISKNSFIGSLVRTLNDNDGGTIKQIIKECKAPHTLTLKIIKKLLNMGILMSELSLSSINNGGISELKDFLHLIDNELSDNLVELNKKLEDYNSLENKTLQLKEYTYITEFMKRMIDSEGNSTNNFVNFNNYFKYPYANIPDFTTNLLTQLPDLDFFRSMYFLTYNYQIMRLFEKYFLDKYGCYSEVDLIDAFLTVEGDSIIPELTQSLKKDVVTQNTVEKFENYIAILIQKHLFLQEDTIFLKDNDIRDIIAILSPLKMHENIRKEVDIKFQYGEQSNLYYLPSLAFSHLLGGYSGKYSKIFNESHSEREYIFDIDYNAKFAPDIGKTYGNITNSVSVENSTSNSSEKINLKDLLSRAI